MIVIFILLVTGVEQKQTVNKIINTKMAVTAC